MVSWLLEKFPETAHIANTNGDQIVHFAAAEGQTKRWLEMLTTCMHVCEIGFLDILKILVEKFGTEIVSRKDSRDTNPVFFAAQQGEAHAHILHHARHTPSELIPEYLGCVCVRAEQPTSL